VVNLQSQKKRSLHGVNEHFFDERNAAGGRYGQTLTKQIFEIHCGKINNFYYIISNSF